MRLKLRQWVVVQPLCLHVPVRELWLTQLPLGRFAPKLRTTLKQSMVRTLLSPMPNVCGDVRVSSSCVAALARIVGAQSVAALVAP